MSGVGDYDKMNGYHNQNDDSLDGKMEMVLPPGAGLSVDARALMQTQHDSTVVFLKRLYSSREFRVYYWLSTALALAALVLLLAVNSIGVHRHNQ